MKVIFLGPQNGRPRFDFGDRAPTEAERERIDGYRLDGNKLVLRDGTVLRPGDELP